MEIFKYIIGIIFGFIGMVIGGIVIGLGTIITFFLVQVLVSGQKNYLLFVSNNKSAIAIYMIVIFIVYILFKLKEKITNKIKGRVGKRKWYNTTEIFTDKESKSSNIIHLIDRLPKTIKSICIIILIIAIYCGLSNYVALYDNKIKLASPLTPRGITYEYSDVESVDVKIKKQGRKSYTPSYKIKLKNNKVIELFGDLMDEEDGETFENILIDFDKKLKAQGVVKKVNKENFEKYSDGLDKDFISIIEKLFEE